MIGRRGSHRAAEYTARRARPSGHMLAANALPLTLSEQLDAMLLGWLERRAAREEAERPGLRSRALVIVADAVMPELERFCASWQMTLRRSPRADGASSVVHVDGPALPVQGLCEIAAMYRRS
jgi:hypothetical protein